MVAQQVLVLFVPVSYTHLVFVATSIILSLLIIYAIINCEISYKYEIENRCGDKIDILWVEELSLIHI